MGSNSAKKSEVTTLTISSPHRRMKSKLEQPKFIPGLILNELFYFEVVKPLMELYFPKLKYSAGLVAHGSDVLGLDNPKSMDHDWGPRLHIFLPEKNFKEVRKKIDETLKKSLPYTYRGFSTNFKTRNDYLVHTPVVKKSGPVNHIFEFWTIRSFFKHYLNYNPYKPISFKDWLIFPQQALLEVTNGKLFIDQLGVERFRKKFEFYPDDVWKYMMRIEWGRISDDLSYQARSGENGDEIGSYILAVKSVEKIMHLAFLIERRYMPYAKHFGTVFKQLKGSKRLLPLLEGILHSKSWRKRQQLIAKSYLVLASMHNSLKITKQVHAPLEDFAGRGYPVIDVGLFIREIEKNIRTKSLQTIKYPLGAVDQFINHVKIHHLSGVHTKLRDLIR